MPVNAPATVGRNARGIADIVQSGRSVVIFGPPGYGKSQLLGSVATILRSDGGDPVDIAATALSHAVPFGSISNGSNLRLALALGGTRPVTATRLLKYARDHGQCERPVISVDDAHLLDAQTMDCLYRLAVGGEIVLLLASDLLPTGPATDAATVRLVDELWVKGGADRVDLEALSPAESSELVTHFAPTGQFERGARALLHSRSGGSRMLLRELTAEVMRQQQPPDDQELVSFSRFPPSRRILDVVAHQLRDLTPDQFAVLALIGRLDGISYSHATLLCRPVALRDLLRRGFLHRRPAGRLHAPTMFSDGALADCDPDLLRNMTAQIVDLLLLDRTHGGVMTSAESLVIADSWTVSAALLPEVLDRLPADTVADILLIAAQRSGRRGLTDRSLLLASLALRLAPGLSTLIEYSRALAGDGRPAAALAELAEAEEYLRMPADGVVLLRWLRELATFGVMTGIDFAALHVRAAGWFTGDPTMAGELAFISLTETVQNQQWPLAVTAGQSLARTPGYDTVTRIHAACLTALSLAQLGRAVEAVRLLDLATDLNERDRSLRESDVYSAEGLALEIFQTDAAIRCLTCFDRSGALEEVDGWITSAIRQGDLGSLALLGFVGGELSRPAGSEQDRWQPWLQCLRATSLARLGLMAAASAARRSTTTDRFDLGFLLNSGTDSAQLLAVYLYETAGNRSPIIRSWLIEIFVQLGQPVGHVTRLLTERDGETDARSASIAVDAPSVSNVGSSVPNGAATRPALEPTDSAKRTESFVASDGARLLTGREKEITILAERGLTNRQIATALYVSVRTVESHLYQARVKTGQRPRAGRAPVTVLIPGASATDLDDEITDSVA
ncbi:LuxR C-terminal-related transcriptional regulator [Cryobacterium sp. Y50]|uniref:LuxR C-terminal-related transcriptional regulator n=1 Tax=Cryobacterium sp. Y50 TaxID=2048286 RepID=UPI000CE4F24C|nr:LuxR C-terminal-related transcriptional regulator [Cryobacterium sp. Y50]